MHQFPSSSRLAARLLALLGVFFLVQLLGLPIAQAADFGEAVQKGPLYAAGVAWLGGLLVSLTPCVYPMIAITVSIFGARQATSRAQGMLLSGAFVLGIVVMFAPLGALAGLTGSLFGSVLQNNWVLVGIALLFLAMAASLFGAFEVALPSSLTNRLTKVGGLGPRGAFGLGLVCGLIAAPCTGPVLTGILTWIAQSQDAVSGSLAMTAFALGLGLPFFLVGTFAVQLPKSGRWMVSIKSVLGIVMTLVALDYLHTAFPVLRGQFPPSGQLYLVLGLCALAGVLLGAVHRDFASPANKDKLLKGLGVSLTVGSLFLALVANSTPTRTLEWQTVSLAEAQRMAQEERSPLLIDFTASWCGACKELEKHTFAHEEVNREAGRFIAVQIDATDDEDPAAQQAMKQFRVVGLPTVILIDSQGKEHTRFNDFVPPERFLSALRQVR